MPSTQSILTRHYNITDSFYGIPFISDLFIYLFIRLLIYLFLVTGSLYLLTPFTYFAHLPSSWSIPQSMTIKAQLLSLPSRGRLQLRARIEQVQKSSELAKSAVICRVRKWRTRKPSSLIPPQREVHLQRRTLRTDLSSLINSRTHLFSRLGAEETSNPQLLQFLSHNGDCRHCPWNSWLGYIFHVVGEGHAFSRFPI